MKNVIIIYRNSDNKNAIQFINSDLEEIFGEYISFTNYYLCDAKDGEILKADAFLVLDENSFESAKERVDDFSKIIKLNRSPDSSALQKIARIPPGSSVLVVNDSYETSLSTIYSFYEVGIGHINMTPYDSSLRHTGIYDKFEIAITPAEAHLVPEHIKEVIDIGYRRVSFDTMFKLMKLLDLDISVINRNLFRHIHSVVESNTAFHANYVYGYLKSEMLSHVVNKSKIGMILVDSNYQTVYANDKASVIFQTDDKNDIDIRNYIDPAILNSSDSIDFPIEILDSTYYYDRFPIKLMDEIAGYYITLQDESDISVSNKLIRQKGYFAKHQFKDIIHRSADMEKVINTAKQIALTDYTVLIRGESGTGKELMAQSIHNASYRKNMPFIAINCAALPDNLLESELFGYEPGAFTGAHNKGKVGLFEQANHGSIFLDEIGDISPKLQSRLLRTIQEKQIMRIGSDRVIDVDIRLIPATNKDLEKAVADGSFRSDLFFRLNVLPIVVPPLRRRKEDILELLKHFLGAEYKNITPEEKEMLVQYNWSGNVRELENVSVFYKSLSSLPEYIYQHTGREMQSASSFLQDNSIDLQLLQIIHSNTTLSHGIGRSSLLYLLKERNIPVSDGKLRELLSQLQKNGYIDVGKGRYGTRITTKGLEYLQERQIEI